MYPLHPLPLSALVRQKAPLRFSSTSRDRSAYGSCPTTLSRTVMMSTMFEDRNVNFGEFPLIDDLSSRSGNYEPWVSVLYAPHLLHTWCGLVFQMHLNKKISLIKTRWTFTWLASKLENKPKVQCSLLNILHEICQATMKCRFLKASNLLIFGKKSITWSSSWLRSGRIKEWKVVPATFLTSCSALIDECKWNFIRRTAFTTKAAAWFKTQN